MFYTKGVDITSDKQMFNFLKNHFTYPTMNSWKQCDSVANNVKVYNLELSGDASAALAILNADYYGTISFMISSWACEHPGYEVYFNGRSGGYLVLKTKNRNDSVLPASITENNTYEEYKDYLRESVGIPVYANRKELIEYTQLVQSFDKLCDEIRDYVDELSRIDFKVYAMGQAVEVFNDRYANDLEMLNFDYLYCAEDGSVDLSEVIRLQSLTEAFMRIADQSANGYKLNFIGDAHVVLQNT